MNEPAELKSENYRLKDTLLRNGYRPCDIAACNCGGWHGGHAERRLHEIIEAMDEAGCQPTRQKTVLVAVKESLAELDSLRSQLAACRELSEALIREADAAADSDDEANIAIGKRDAAARIRFAIGESRPHCTPDPLARVKALPAKWREEAAALEARINDKMGGPEWTKAKFTNVTLTKCASDLEAATKGT